MQLFVYRVISFISHPGIKLTKLSLLMDLEIGRKLEMERNVLLQIMRGKILTPLIKVLQCLV
jgi:hypothetical protein